MISVKPLPNKLLFILIVILISIKLILFVGVKIDMLSITTGGGSDADYYHGYALGNFIDAVNIWPVILRNLNDIGLYDRDIVSYLLLGLNLIFIPILSCKLANLNFKKNQKHFFYLYILCLIYPTLFFFTFDIYRDVFMVFSFLVSCLIVKKMLNTRNILSFILFFIISLSFGWFLFKLRPYLGLSFILSIFLFRIKFTKNKIILFGLLYIIILFLAFTVGALDSLIEYRSGFEELKGGSTLGLDFTNPAMFIPNLIFSTLGQLFGLYIINPFAFILFIIESLPFIVMLAYIIKNVKLADSFLRFLIIFFVIYSSVWLLGNDNLGTAVRLRFYNYIIVYICFFYMLQIKQSIANKRIQVEA